MSAIYNAILNVINSMNYNADSLIEKIETFWVQEKLTGEERAELIQKAYDNARDVNQVDVMVRLADLEKRVYALENPTEEGEPEVSYPVWESGYITSKGEIVQYDYNNDGTLDLLQYNGGRATTTLSPGKVSGWNVLDPQTLEIIGTFYKGEFTPVSNEQEEPTEPAGEGE